MLTEQAVIEIRQMYEERHWNGRRVWSHEQIAKRFGTSSSTVRRIVSGLGAYAGLERVEEARQRGDAASTEEIAASRAKVEELLRGDRPDFRREVEEYLGTKRGEEKGS